MLLIFLENEPRCQTQRAEFLFFDLIFHFRIEIVQCTIRPLAQYSFFTSSADQYSIAAAPAGPQYSIERELSGKLALVGRSLIQQTRTKIYKIHLLKSIAMFKKDVLGSQISLFLASYRRGFDELQSSVASLPELMLPLT